MTYWIVVGGAVNYEKARDEELGYFGFKSTRKREASGMKPGDKLIFYLTGVMKFGGLATVTSEYYEDHEKVFVSAKKPNEDYPWRVRIEPEIMLDAGSYVDVKEVAPRMEYIKKWPAEHWRLAFQGNLHQIPASDYEMIRGEIEQAAKARA